MAIWGQAMPRSYNIGDVYLYTEPVANPYRWADNELVEIAWHNRRDAFRHLGAHGQFPPHVAEVWHAPMHGAAERLDPKTVRYVGGLLTGEVLPDA